jgi:hypothetical protein
MKYQVLVTMTFITHGYHNRDLEVTTVVLSFDQRDWADAAVKRVNGHALELGKDIGCTQFALALYE